MTLFVLLFVIGIGVGAVSGALGVGGGFIMVPVLVLVAGLDQHMAQGTSLLAIFPITLFGALSARRRGLVDVSRGLALGAIGVIGSVAASQIAVNFVPGSTLKTGFAVLLAIVALRMLYSGLVSERRPSTSRGGPPAPHDTR
jgi:uncharacterized membrane protein YfcA